MKFADTILEMRDLNVIFPTSDGDVRAVDRVDLRISAGETFGLIGESGSGKTVLGMAALRLLPSYARVGGEILFGGRDLLLLDEEDMRQVRGGEIAMVLQNTATSLNPVVSVGDRDRVGRRSPPGPVPGCGKGRRCGCSMRCVSQSPYEAKSIHTSSAVGCGNGP